MAHILSSVKGTEEDFIQITRALLSVSDKTNLIPLARELERFGVEILSTGGTAKAMREAGLNVIDVSDYTGSPEILDGRVKTLHPMIHGGLLAVRGNLKHESEMIANKIQKIDLVVMNLYPFEATVNSGADFEMCVENIDIGGPSMLRSSAKNHKYVTILTHPNQYEVFLKEFLASNGSISLQRRTQFAAAAFATSARYDAHIAQYFQSKMDPNQESLVPITRTYQPQFALKYGCNPHQKPSVIYSALDGRIPFRVLNGTPGYINLLDACNAWQLVFELKQALGLPASASFKHCSPAGAALGIPLTDPEAAAYEISTAVRGTLTPTALAYIRARNADPMCSFGDFAALSHPVDVATANILRSAVCDGIIAPGYDPEALEVLVQKKKGGFIVLQADEQFIAPVMEFREMFGVVFSQRRNDVLFNPAQHLSKIVVGESPFSEATTRDLVLASIAIKYTQSNSVGYALNGQMIGVGAGQQSRVDCVKLAGRKVSTWYLRQHPLVQSLPFLASVKKQDRVNARVRYIEGDMTDTERTTFNSSFETSPPVLTAEDKAAFLGTLTNVSVASDAFFPFRDSIDHASKFGVKYIAQAGGSIADDEVIAACKEYGMTMAFTDLRLFHH